ncbi:MAG: tetratricopeptide repeat protein [Candidatus Lokiarchaeota archaeon]
MKKLGRIEEAFKSYDKVIELDDSDSDAWFDKGATFISLGNYKDALICLDKVIKLNSKDKEALNVKGGILINYTIPHI